LPQKKQTPRSCRCGGECRRSLSRPRASPSAGCSYGVRHGCTVAELGRRFQMATPFNRSRTPRVVKLSRQGQRGTVETPIAVPLSRTSPRIS
jgi:hypothetical protein